MSGIRSRVKDQFPTVLLTLLSMVQALALELLWSRLIESTYLDQLPEHQMSADQDFFAMIIFLTQIICTFVGLIIIWVVYASNVMRFRWVPGTVDSVNPFIIGVLEFFLVEFLGVETLGWWFLTMATVFALMIWVGHRTMLSARLDLDNEYFFRNLNPAVVQDFYPDFTVIAGALLISSYFFVQGYQPVAALLAVLVTLSVLLLQFYKAASFWQRSVDFGKLW